MGRSTRACPAHSPVVHQQRDERRGHRDEQQRGGAAREYDASDVYFQISVASVSNPIGRSSSVAGRLHRRGRRARRRREAAADERHGHAGEPTWGSAQPTRRLLHARAHRRERRRGAGERLREEAHDVREDEQRERLVQRPCVPRGEEHEGERDHDAGERIRGVRRPLQRDRPRSPPAACEEGDREHGDRGRSCASPAAPSERSAAARQLDVATALDRPVDEHRQRDDEEESDDEPAEPERGPAPASRERNPRRRSGGPGEARKPVPRRVLPSRSSTIAVRATRTSASTAAGSRSKSARYWR